jgi:plasmid stabilization system protein ParE
MKAIERYLQTVRSYLPKEPKEDIIRELSENILSELAAQENQLGRPLLEAEVRAALERLGDPLRVAAGYRQEERTVAFGRRLIGPALFPVYARVLWANLSLTLLACILVAAILHGHGDILHSLPAMLTHLGVQFLIVTIIFIVAEVARDCKTAKHGC